MPTAKRGACAFDPLSETPSILPHVRAQKDPAVESALRLSSLSPQQLRGVCTSTRT